jgi:hypothetical protein
MATVSLLLVELGGDLFLVVCSNRHFYEHITREQRQVVDMLFSEIFVSLL